MGTEVEIFSKQVQGDPFVMVWGAISYKSPVALGGIDDNLDCTYYYAILKDPLIGKAEDLDEDGRNFKHKNASIHGSSYTKD